MKNPAGLSDEDLIIQVRDKNQELYSQVIDRYQAKLLRYAVNLAGDDQLAQDIVQNAFIKAFINLKSFNPKLKFSSWIYRIVHNEAVNLLKKRQPLPLSEKIDFASSENIENEFIKKELKIHARRCLNKMELKYREPLTLFFFEERTYTEISDILRLPVNTVGTRINRAKVIMKKLCQNLIK